MEDSTLNEPLLKKLFRLTLVYQLLALAIIGTWAFVTFGKSDWKIIWVPQAVLEWALIGSVAGVLYRLSRYTRLSASEKAELYLWAITKPFLGTAFGAVIYFLAVGGVLVLNGTPEIKHTELLAGLAFIAAFSDRFSISVLERFTQFDSSRSKHQHDANKQA
jgi:hypothetical protein